MTNSKRVAFGEEFTCVHNLFNKFLRTEKLIPISFQIEWNMIVVAVFLLILSQMELNSGFKIERNYFMYG